MTEDVLKASKKGFATRIDVIISKLYDIPIKTLRYYDEIGLLKPAKGVEETEIQLRKAFLESGSRGNEVYPIFGAVCNYEKYCTEGVIEYQDIREYLLFEGKKEGLKCLPAGKYLAIYFDEPASEKDKYYKLLTLYIREHMIWKISRLMKCRQLAIQKAYMRRIDIYQYVAYTND